MRPTLILLALLLIPLPSPAQGSPPAAASPAQPTAGAAEEIDEWRQTRLEARERLDEAQVQVTVAQQAFRNARHRKRRGDERGELQAALGAAEQELAEAEAQLPVLLDEARRAGVPPGVLREFED